MISNATPDEASAKYAEHEALYHHFTGQPLHEACGLFFVNPALPDYYDANHAALLRTNDSSPTAIAQKVIQFYRERGMRVAADIDSIAEAQGIGAELRRHGVMPVVSQMKVMRWSPDHDEIDLTPAKAEIEIEIISPASDEAEEWVSVLIASEETEEERSFWGAVANAESSFSGSRLTLARLNGKPVGACNLFSANGWGRIDSVATHPNSRRLGVASKLVTEAVAESLSQGNAETYLTVERGNPAEILYSKLGFKPWKLSIPRRHLSLKKTLSCILSVSLCL